jgi:hypothetical protein
VLTPARVAWPASGALTGVSALAAPVLGVALAG